MNTKEYAKQYYQKNKARLKAYKKKYNAENKERNAKACKAYNDSHKAQLSDHRKKYRKDNIKKIKENIVKNKDKISAWARSYNQKNRFIISEKRKRYYEKHRCEILANNKKWRAEHKDERRVYQREYSRKHKKIRRENNPTYKFIETIRRRISVALRTNNKSGKSVELLGCSAKFGRQYIEDQWYSNKLTGEPMSWKNHNSAGAGRWQIHHIIPLQYFDMNNPEEQRKAFHYSNCQPLWFEDHLEAHRKLRENEILKEVKRC